MILEHQRVLTDIAFADFFSDLNIRAIWTSKAFIRNLSNALCSRKTLQWRTDGTDKQAAIQAELHVGCARRFCSRSRDVLTNVGGRDKYLCQRDRVVRKEEHLQIIFCVGIRVNHTRDVDDESDGLYIQNYPLLVFSSKSQKTIPILPCNLSIKSVKRSLYECCIVHPGAALPAKNTTRGLTPFFSLAFMFLIRR